MIYQTLDAIGRREATTVATATTQKVFASLTTTGSTNRKLVNLCNLDTAANLYVRIANATDSAPTVSSTNCDAVVGPLSREPFEIGYGLALWIRSSSGSSVNYTALEVL